MPQNVERLCAEFYGDSKTVLVFVLALIVFDFYSFEGHNDTFYRRSKYSYIYIYIYIYILYIYIIHNYMEHYFGVM